MIAWRHAPPSREEQSRRAAVEPLPPSIRLSSRGVALDDPPARSAGRYEQLVAQARGRGLPVEHIRQDLEFFKFGCPPHGGFGLGLTRMLMSLLGVSDVREVTYLFRGPDRLSP